MAANNIKGLTVEIGGDTTKLGKALEDVNKRSRDLSSELGQINKLTCWLKSKRFCRMRYPTRPKSSRP